MVCWDCGETSGARPGSLCPSDGWTVAPSVMRGRGGEAGLGEDTKVSLGQGEGEVPRDMQERHPECTGMGPQGSGERAAPGLNRVR